MRCRQFGTPRSGNLVCQILGSVTFAYDVCLCHSRDHWKGLIKEKNNGIENTIHTDMTYVKHDTII